MIKEILEDHGYEEGATGSPKTILKTAFQAGMIKDEDLWLHALQERNNVAHSYNQKIALEIVKMAWISRRLRAEPQKSALPTELFNRSKSQ